MFTTPAPITFGQSLRCALSIPGHGIPSVHVLFARDQGRFLLRVPAHADARLAQGDTIRSDLRAGETIPLASGARGRLTIGDATILFQEIAAPRLVPRPQLPASVRGTLGDRIDRRLAVIVGASLAAHLVIGVWAWMTDVDTGSMLSPNVAMYHQETMDVTLPDLDAPSVLPTVPTTSEPGTAVPVAPHQTPAPIVRPTQVHTTAPDPQRMLEDADRMAQILTGGDPGRTGFGEMGKRQPSADLDKQLAALRDGHGRVTVGDTGHGFRQDTGPHLGDGTGPLVDDPGSTTQLPGHHDERPTGRITVKPLPSEASGTSLTVDTVLGRITSVYMAGLQRCYKQGLAHEASLGGKVALSFTVNATGHLEDIEAGGVSSDVDTCISSQMAGWRFPVPKDKSGEPSDASFALALALQPS